MTATPRKISEMPSATVIADADLLPIVDVSESAISSKNKKVTVAQILASLPDGAITSAKIADGAIVDADVNASAAIADTKLATIATAGKVSNSATTATNANTASAIVARDGSGNFSAGTITAALAGNASTVTTNANLTGDVTSVGNATSIAAGVVVDADVNASAGIVASKLSFTQAGTGAVARTVDSKLKDVVSVKDFGAVGDGVADDTAAIQAAINYAKSQNGAVNFLAKNYKITSTLIVTGTFRSIHLQGTQTGNHQTAASGGTCIIFSAVGVDEALRAEFLEFANENITIDGINFYNPLLSKLNGGYAIKIVRGASNSRYVSGFRFSNVGVQGFAVALGFQGLNTADAGNNFFGNTLLENFSAQTCGYGLQLANAILNLVTLSNTLFFDCQYGGIVCERNGEVGAGNGKGSAFTGTLCNKTHFEGVGGMFRTDPVTVLDGLGDIIRSSITLIDFTHEFCGSVISGLIVTGEPFQLGVNTDIHVLGDAVDGLSYGEVLLPYLNSTARIWCSSHMRVVVNGGRIMTPRGVNAPTLFRTILNGNSTTINVPLVEATTFAVKSHLLLAGGQGGYIESQHYGAFEGVKTNISTGSPGAGVTLTWGAAPDANAISVTIANASGYAYTAELQIENLSSASITVASDV